MPRFVESGHFAFPEVGEMTLEDQIAAIKTEIHGHRHHCLAWHGLSELERLIEQLEATLAPYRQYLTPASARFAAYPKGSIMAGTVFASGSTISLVGTVDNAQGIAIPNAVTWTADQGTITADPTNPELATLVNVPDGTVNVTMTTTNDAAGVPIVVTHAFTVTDIVPATADFTASAS